jgi:putative phosphoribosyl transferase
MPIVESQWTTMVEHPVSIEVGDVRLKGDLVVPEESFGLILFAAGIGVSRSSSRARRIARELEEQGLATLTFDLFTAEEEAERFRNGRHGIDIPLLAGRLAGATAWAKRQSSLRDFPIGYFAAGDDAAPLLVAAAGQRGLVDAVVCGGGRADLAGSALAQIQAPTLLVLGDGDASLVHANESAFLRLGSPRKELILIPGASSRFDGPGELEMVAELTADWFSRYLILVS